MLNLSDILSNPAEYYSSIEVAHALKVSKSTIDVWLRRKKIQSKKVGIIRLVKGEWVSNYLNSLNNGGK